MQKIVFVLAPHFVMTGAALAERKATGPVAIGKWSIDSFISPMDDSESRVLSLTANKVVEGWLGKKAKPTLHIRCGKANGLEVFINLGMQRAPQSDATLRFDKESPETYLLNSAGTSDTVFIAYPQRLLLGMRGKKTLLFQFEPFNAVRQVAEFSVVGFDKNIDLLALPDCKSRWPEVWQSLAEREASKAAEAAREEELRKQTVQKEAEVAKQRDTAEKIYKETLAICNLLDSLSWQQCRSATVRCYQSNPGNPEDLTKCLVPDGKDGIDRAQKQFQHTIASRGKIGVTIKSKVVEGLAPGGAAEEAGLKVGDVIESANGVPLIGNYAHDALLITGEPGSEVRLSLIRGGEKLEMRIIRRHP